MDRRPLLLILHHWKERPIDEGEILACLPEAERSRVSRIVHLATGKFSDEISGGEWGGVQRYLYDQAQEVNDIASRMGDCQIRYYGLAEVPSVIAFGAYLRDGRLVEAYDYHRRAGEHAWRWPSPERTLHVEHTGLLIPHERLNDAEAVLCVEVSYPIHERDIRQLVDLERCVSVRIRPRKPADPRRGIVRSAYDVAGIRDCIADVMAELASLGLGRIHVLVAAPVSVCFVVGQELDIYNGPPVQTYRYRRAQGYQPAILLQGAGLPSAIRRGDSPRSQLNESAHHHVIELIPTDDRHIRHEFDIDRPASYKVKTTDERNREPPVGTIRIDWPERLDDLRRLRSTERDDEGEARLAQWMSRSLTDVGNRLIPRIEEALEQAHERPIYITMRLHADELCLLPWELLGLENGGMHLAELRQVCIGYELLDAAEVPAQTEGTPQRLLFAWSGRVPHGQHLEVLQRASSDGLFRFDAESDVLGNVSIKRLASTLDQAAREGSPFTTLHVLCHGGQEANSYALQWCDDNGEPQQVTAGWLRSVLHEHRSTLRLVCLLACHSSTIGEAGTYLDSPAQAVHRVGIPWVIGSRYPLSKSGSIEFASAFYEDLRKPDATVDRAFAHARRTLRHDVERRDWLGMQLYVRRNDRGRAW